MPFGIDLVALVLEVVLGQPVAVVAELARPRTPMSSNRSCRVPEVLLLVAPAHRRRRPRPGIVDLDAAEEEDPYTHGSIMTQRHEPASQLHDDVGELLALVLLQEVPAALDGGVRLTLRAGHRGPGTHGLRRA